MIVLTVMNGILCAFMTIEKLETELALSLENGNKLQVGCTASL